mmetsp:Transcript_39629/g.95767  ORF Transcript_39629/g.95767 Transcript_39629/m.95767 type:complete len:1289 (-) Transcript_39629:69-3935(-)
MEQIRRITRRFHGVVLVSVLLGQLTLQGWSFPLTARSSGRLSSSSTFATSIEAVDDTERIDSITLGRSDLAKYFDFPLDDWQLQAGGEILKGHNIIVCSPTGSGKTVCGEMALHAAFDRDLDGIYTTPLKALSNQKFAELRQRFGAVNVGLSTGDVSINRQQARLTVMTTEVYRNIAWRSTGSVDPAVETGSKTNSLKKNAVVVLDELHYMGIPGRGGVWEECIITSPPHTQIIGLSATLPNARQLADWMEGVTGRKTILIDAPGARPVPLKYLFATREGIYPLFRNPDAGPGSELGLLGYRGDGISRSEDSDSKSSKNKENDDVFTDFEDLIDEKLPRGLRTNPALEQMAQRRMQRVNRALERQREKQNRIVEDFDDWDFKGGRGRSRRSSNTRKSNREERRERDRLLKREMRKSVPSLPVMLERLKEKDLLPAIFFIFSRAGCDAAADSIRSAYKGPRDPFREIDFDAEEQDFNVKKKNKKKIAKKKASEDGFVEDGDGRRFRMSSDNINEDTFISLMEERQADISEDDLVSASPLRNENWNFYSTSGLLTSKEVETVARRVAQFNDENEEIAFTENVIEQFLFGVGSHHAGMLPAHKAFVETLFRANLMKACFATETLAAGINMPARTTVVCALAKRDGSGSMSLLETSNLLQMAGRAGRRGMDTSGTCVIVATPFESHDAAAQILTNPIKPISSQFRPSYSLAVNLISRGQGKLDVAKQLVSKSFAMWEKLQMEKRITSASDEGGVGNIIRSVAEDRFLSLLMEVLDRNIQKKNANLDVAYLQFLVSIFNDRELLKKTSKEYESAALSLDLEETTLGCLELELKDAIAANPALADGESTTEDEKYILDQVEEQRKRVDKFGKRARKHVFASLATITNELMMSDDEDGWLLSDTFKSMKSGNPELLAEDFVSMAKSALVVKRKLRKLAKTMPDATPESLLLEAGKVTEIKDGTWDDMLAITKVLTTFGCLETANKTKSDIFDDIEDQVFDVTPAGTDVGMLSFENALWGFVAMGGTWDVLGTSASYDEFNSAMSSFEDDMNLFDDDESSKKDESSSKSAPHLEAEDLVNHLLELSPSEMAGYVSCLVCGDTARSSLSAMDVFKRLSSRQQRAIQVLLDSTDRLSDVQRQFEVDARASNCQFDVTHSEVVAAWADGCSWSEAMEMSGAAPGDLTRIIGRALDAVRQYGALKYTPLRRSDAGGDVIVDPFSRGIHPELRRKCREAAKAMNRYPVKDPLPFEAEEEEMFVDEQENVVAKTEDSTEEESTEVLAKEEGQVSDDADSPTV